jgi:predicted aspartyl protease
MVYSHDYDSQYPNGPAMPIVELHIKQIGSEESSAALSVIVDSGADGTILPLRNLQNAGIERVGQARMRWGPHVNQLYDIYLANLQIGPYKIYGVRILADKQNSQGILGRNVLNQMVVTLNGLAGVVEIRNGA